MKALTLALACGLLATSTWAQTRPEVLPKEHLPATAPCAICKGGDEPVSAGVRHRGEVLYFCSEAELTSYLAQNQSGGATAVPT